MQPKLARLPASQCGGTNPWETGDGAYGGGEPSSRSLSGPSPSANLVGIWKGDPLVPACAGHHGLPDNKRVACRHGDMPVRCATTSETGYDNNVITYGGRHDG